MPCWILCFGATATWQLHPSGHCNFMTCSEFPVQALQVPVPHTARRVTILEGSQKPCRALKGEEQTGLKHIYIYNVYIRIYIYVCIDIYVYIYIYICMYLHPLPCISCCNQLYKPAVGQGQRAPVYLLPGTPEGEACAWQQALTRPKPRF